MSDLPVPSYRVRSRRAEGSSLRMLAFAGGLLAAVSVVGAVVWGLSGSDGPRIVPVVEADPRPVKVRPDDPGGMRVANQDELIFERRSGSDAPVVGARLAPGPEMPNLERLWAQVAPQQPAATPSLPPPEVTQPLQPQPVISQPAAAPPPAAPTVEVAPEPAPVAAPAPAPVPTPASIVAPAARQIDPRIQVQLGALASEDAARTEWDRLSRRMPELLSDRRPQIMRFDRDGGPTMWRLRTSGFPDGDAAREFCNQVRARGGVCAVIGA